jgi:hypothetical protein
MQRRDVQGMLLFLVAAAACGPRPGAVPGQPAAPPLLAAVGDAEGLRLIDLRGVVEPRSLLLGGGWKGAAWVGCTSYLALDRDIDGERRLSILGVENGQLFPADVPPLADRALDPAVIEALVQAFGEEAAFPEDRLADGALRRAADGRPAVELVGSGEEEDPDRVVGLEPLALAGPVERALAGEESCVVTAGMEWVARSPHGVEALPGDEVEGWSCRRRGGAAGASGESGEGAESGEVGPSTGSGQGGPGLVGTSVGEGDAPLSVELPGGGTVVLPDSAPVDGYEVCASAGDEWLMVRVEQPGLYGFDALYVVRVGDAAVFRVAQYDVTDLVVAGIAVVGPRALLYGGPDGWFLVGRDGEPVRVSDFPPAVR